MKFFIRTLSIILLVGIMISLLKQPTLANHLPTPGAGHIGNCQCANPGDICHNCYGSEGTPVQDCPGGSIIDVPSGSCSTLRQCAPCAGGSNTNPVGSHDGLGPFSTPAEVHSQAFCTQNGWAVDPDNTSQDVPVRLLNNASGTQIGSNFSAGAFRSDLGGLCSGGTCAWDINVWNNISKNQPYQFRAQARDLTDTTLWVNLNNTNRWMMCVDLSCNIAGPTAVCPNQPRTYSVTGTGTGIANRQISHTLTSSPTGWTSDYLQPANGSVNVSVPAGQYYFACNAYGPNASRCTGNPFGVGAGWIDCGGSDNITVNSSFANCTRPVVTLVSPPNGSSFSSSTTSMNLQANVVWNTYNNTRSREIWVRDVTAGAGFSRLCNYSADTGDLTFGCIYSGLVTGHSYQWYATATNEGGTSQSSTWQFNIGNQPPVVTLVSPSNGSSFGSSTTVLNLQANVVWNTNNNTRNRQIWTRDVTTGAGFTQLCTYSADTGDLTFGCLYSGLISGHTYQWYATAANESGTSQSSTWQFSISPPSTPTNTRTPTPVPPTPTTACAPTAPASPVKVSPPNGSTQTGTTANLAWNATTSWGNDCGDGTANDNYVVTLTNPAGSTTTYTLARSSTSQSIGGTAGSPQALVPGTYTWNVSATNGPRQSAAVPPFTFTVIVNANWFQSNGGGGVHSNGSTSQIASSLPAGQSLILDPNLTSYNFPGILTSSSGSYALNSQPVSNTGWNAQTVNRARRYDYAYFRRRIAPTVNLRNYTADDIVSPGELGAALATGTDLYWEGSSVHFDGVFPETLFANKKVSILVADNVIIGWTAPITSIALPSQLNGQSSLLLVAEGVIRVKEDVTRLDGIYMASVQIRTTPGTPPLNSSPQLRVNGSMLSYGSVILGRDTVDTTAAEYFDYRPDILIALGQEWGRVTSFWQEAAP